MKTLSTVPMLMSAATGTGAADRPRDRTTRQKSTADFMAGCCRGDEPARRRQRYRQPATRQQLQKVRGRGARHSKSRRIKNGCQRYCRRHELENFNHEFKT